MITNLNKILGETKIMKSISYSLMMDLNILKITTIMSA